MAQPRYVLLDVDGVLTPGALHYGPEGELFKDFSVRDGQRIRYAQAAGITVGLCSGRDSKALRARAADLDLAPLLLGVGDKLACVQAWADKEGVDLKDVAAMGDDWPDLALLEAVGYAAVPADADPRLRRRMTLVTRAPGGHGAVAEFLQTLVTDGQHGHLLHG